MTDFGEWIREWEQSGKRLAYTEDLANLCAQQHGALVRMNYVICEDESCTHTVCPALRAAAEFQEKYQ